MDGCPEDQALNWLDRETQERLHRQGQELLQRARRRAVNWHPVVEDPRLKELRSGEKELVQDYTRRTESGYESRSPMIPEHLSKPKCTFHVDDQDRILLQQEGKEKPVKLDTAFKVMMEYMDYISTQCGRLHAPATEKAALNHVCKYHQNQVDPKSSSQMRQKKSTSHHPRDSYQGIKIDPGPTKIIPGPFTFDPGPSTFDPRPSTFYPRPYPFDLVPPTFDPELSTFDPGTPTFDPGSPTFDPGSPMFDPGPSRFNPRPPRFEPELSTIDSEPSTTDSGPSTPGPGPSTPGPGPSTPGPGPSTPGPGPSTPGPGPSTPGPGPSTPGPGPSTPGPGPSTPGLGPSTPGPRPSMPSRGPSRFDPGPSRCDSRLFESVARTSSKDIMIEVFPGTYAVTVGSPNVTTTHMIEIDSGQIIDLNFPL